ncbi:MAG: hypothetical protein ACJA1L_001054 [Paracoccaceae bacterium]|jgi:hypothetical protein
MRFSIVACCLTFGLLGCAGPSIVAPGTPYRMIGVSMTSPNEPGWIAVKPNEASLAFGKKGARAGDTVFVQMSLIKIDDKIADDQFRAEVEHAKTVNDNPADLLPPEMRVAAIEFKGAVCVSYDGAAKYVAGKGGGPGPRYVKALGYTCRHPMIMGMAVDIALSERAGAPALAPAGRASAKAFFDTVVFTDAGTQ